jgi:NAD-dependent SIR2 family protein deacetylase
MFSRQPSPTKCHEFIAWLEEMNKVSIIVTQNCDMLHHLSGSKKVLECHGTFRTAHCLYCDKKFHLTDYKHTISDGMIPRCECGGIIKPDIVFFGEKIPEDFYQVINFQPEADMILILGTSLNVQPSSKFALEIAERVPSVIVNLEPTQYDDEMTYVLHVDLDEFAEKVWEVLATAQN